MHACFPMGKRMSSHLPPLCLDYFLAEISDISKVQQVIFIIQDPILVEMVNAEIVDSDIIHAIELIVFQASSGTDVFVSWWSFLRQFPSDA